MSGTVTEPRQFRIQCHEYARMQEIIAHVVSRMSIIAHTDCVEMRICVPKTMSNQENWIIA